VPYESDAVGGDSSAFSNLLRRPKYFNPILPINLLVELGARMRSLLGTNRGSIDPRFGPILKDYSNRYPERFRRQFPPLYSISRLLRVEREICFDGDELGEAHPESFCNKEDALEALVKTQEVLRLY